MTDPAPTATPKTGTESCRVLALVARGLGVLADHPGRAAGLVGALAAAMVAADFLYAKHPEFGFDGWPMFFPAFGFVVYAAVIFVAKGLRLVIRRPEDYWGPRTIDAEDGPGRERADG